MLEALFLDKELPVGLSYPEWRKFVTFHLVRGPRFTISCDSFMNSNDSSAEIVNILMESLGEAARNILAPIPLGIRKKEGVVKASIVMQAEMTDHNLKYSGVATDISNPFNNRERKRDARCTLCRAPPAKSMAPGRLGIHEPNTPMAQGLR